MIATPWIYGLATAGGAVASSPAQTPTPRIGVHRARDVRQARLPRSAQAGGRRDRVRQSRHHRTAADGRLRGRERHPLHPRPAGGRADGDGRRLRAGLRQAHGAQPPRRAGPRQRHGHALRRADGGLADPGDRRPAGHRISRRGADPLGRPADAGEAVREILRAGRARSNDLPRFVHRAAKTALAPPTGPVFLSLPGDILKNDGDIDLLDADARRAARARRHRRGRTPPPNCWPRPSGRSSSPATPWRRAARTRSWRRWPKRSARRSTPSSCRTPRRSPPRIRSIAAR